MPSPKPAVIVRREFEFTPEVVTQQLRACIVGPACQLVRFNKAAEKSKGFVATVSTLASEPTGAQNLLSQAADKLIPNLAISSVLDTEFIKVFMEDALLSYGEVTEQDFTDGAGGTTTNQLVLSSTSWKGTAVGAGGETVSRDSDLAQDVEVGDTVQLYTESGGNATLRHTTTVAGFVAETIPAAAGTPTFSKQGDLAASSLTTYAGGGITFTPSAASAFTTASHMVADPRQFGKTSTNYTIVITGYSGSQITFDVISDTGADSAFNRTLTLGSGTIQLPSGITIAAALTTAGNTVTVGTTVNFSYTPAHTSYSIGAAGSALTLYLSGTVLEALPKDTTYYVTCISGGSVKSATGATFRVSTNNGADVVSTFTVNNISTNSTAIKAIGSYGLSLTFGKLSADTFAAGFKSGDQYVIPVVAAKNGPLKTLVVADPFTTSIAPSRVRVSKKKTVQVPALQFGGVAVNWSINNAVEPSLRAINIRQKMRIRDASVNAGNTDVNITAGKLYFEYRAFLALPREIGSVLTLSDITSQLGVIDSDNPLAYAVFKAWSNANGATVHFIPTVNQTLNGERGFADALALAKGQRNCYSLVPLSTNPEVWNAFVGHAIDESSPSAGRYRIVWIAPEIDQHFKIQDSPVGAAGTIITATSAARASVAGQYVISVPTSLNTKFTETVRAGDWVRTNFGVNIFNKPTFTEYRILSVIDNNTLVIASATNPSLVSAQIEIFRDLSSAEMAAEYVKVSGGFSSERVFAVVPNRGVNGLRVDGVPVKNWYVAAAFAGLRSGSRAHQPLSNVELLGFDGANATVPAFNETDLDTLRDGGIWVVMNDNEGKIYAERQLSTSTLDNFRKEQSVTCNIDSMSFSIADGLKNLVGRVNITDANIATVRGALASILDGFRSAVGSETIGAQLRNYTIEEVTIPATANDTVRAKISVTVPLPMNVIDITLVV